MTLPQSFTALAPLDELARALMDHGYSLAARADVHHEYCRLAQHERDDVIVVYRCGCVYADGPRAARLLCTMAGGVR